jgi:hypothetical protein
MKDNKYKKGFLLLVALFVFSGCEDFLSTEPDSTRAAIDTPEKVSQLLVTGYPRGSYLLFAESMSDNVADFGRGEDDRTNRGSFLFNEVETTVDFQDSPDMYWAECYRAISVANQALKICNEAENPEAFRAQKGEALLARAYAHFMLVSFFSKFYDPTTPNSDPGIPYVTEPEEVVIKKYERRTVAYVYEMIEKDLTEGLPLINDAGYTVPKYHFTIAAANAFATRFYLIKRDYQKVIDHAKAIYTVATLRAGLRPWNTTYASMSPDQLYKTYSTAGESANLLLVETVSWYPRYLGVFRYGLSYAKYAEISYPSRIADVNARWVFPLYYRQDNNYFIPKLDEYFVRESASAEIGVGYVMVPLLTAEEVLFNLTEAYVNLGLDNEALELLNVYVSKRITNYTESTDIITTAKINRFYGTSSNTKQGLLNTVHDFKRMEFLQEGLRWFDVQRLGITVTHETSDGTIITVPKDDPRRVVQIPQSAVLSGIELNPR